MTYRTSMLWPAGLALVVAGGAALAQEEIGTSQQPLSTGDSVYFVNPTDTEMIFSVRPRTRTGEWDEHTLAAHEDVEIYCECDAPAYDFSILTTGVEKEVAYRLDIGKRYAFEWNEDEGVWDLYEMTFD